MKKISFLIVGCLLCAAASAEDKPLSWDDCLREARAKNPEIVSARAKVEEAKADKNITKSGALPQISVTGGATTAKTEGRARTKLYDYGVTAQQLLFDGFKTSNDLAAAREQVKVSSYEYLVTSSDVRLTLRSAYVGLLGAQEFLQVTRDIVDRRKQNEELVSLRYQSGRENKGALLTAQANLASAEFEFEQAQRSVDLYQRRLSKALGREKFMPLSVSGDLAVAAIDQMQPDFEMFVSSVPLLKQLVAKKEAARFGLKSAKSDLFPKIYATGNAGKSGTAWAPETDDWSAGISVTFPLFEGGQKQAAITKARASLNQVEADERSGRDGVILTLAETWTAWQDNVALVSVKQKFLDASGQRAEISEAQYSSGLISFNDWILIEDELVSNQKAFLQAKTAALVSEAGWRQAKGETLDD